MTGFCEKCRDVVAYSTKEITKSKNIKGKEVIYVGKEAYCTECGNEIFVAEVRDYNLQKLDTAFRTQENLIAVSEIESILAKYDIGKRPLSLLLGWGEGTVTRYLNGDIPTKQYSDTLKRILGDSRFMREIIEQNKESLTEIAYNRSKRALEKVESENHPPSYFQSAEKIDSVAKYFLVNCVEITPLAMQKLLYYAQGFYKVFSGEYLFNDDCEAWVHGPVYRSIYNKYKNYGYNPIEEKAAEYGKVELTNEEQELLEIIMTNFGCYSGKILEKMAHMEAPWRETRKGLSDSEESNRIIKKDLIANYFTGIKSKYHMLNISDVRDYSQDLFRKICH